MWRDALDLIFPIACLGCGRPTQHTRPETEANAWMCARCLSTIRSDAPTCIVCHTRAPTGRTCSACASRTPLVGTVAVGPYRDPLLQAAVLHLKFHGIRILARPLGALLASRLIARGLHPSAARSVLVPLPLHPRRERGRGYNQAQLIADTVSAHTRLPVQALLRRSRATAAQTSLLGSGSARRKNLRGAFTLVPNADVAPDVRYILVDDVLTSGTTLDEAACTLAAAGARDLWAAVAARG